MSESKELAMSNAEEVAETQKAREEDGESVENVVEEQQSNEEPGVQQRSDNYHD